MTSSSTPPSSRRTLTLNRTSTPLVEERLHKVLAQAGLGSRRALEERIENGQVSVNGEVASIGLLVKSGDRIELDGKSFVATIQSETPRVLIYNKPEGEVTTRDDPEGRPTVFDRLPFIKGARWVNVGRLDINTSGLLLLTTDGELSNALTSPANEVPREYVCRIFGDPTPEQIQQLTRGVTLEDGPARFDEIERIGASESHAWFRVVLHEGRNREVRRLWEAMGYQVSRLKRVRYGQIELPRLLKRGHYEELPESSVQQLRQQLKLDQADPVLTLQPVIRQRRAKVAEYRPAPREQRAWTQDGYGDESRELRAFDNLREDRPGKKFGGKPGGFKKPGGPHNKTGGFKKKGGHFPPDDLGNRLTAPGGGKPYSKPRRKAAAPGFENPTEHRSWYVPEGVTTTSRIAPARHVGRPSPWSERSDAPRGKPAGARPGMGKPGGGKPGGRPGGSSARPAGGKPGGYSPSGKGRPSGPSRGGPGRHSPSRAGKPRG